MEWLLILALGMLGCGDEPPPTIGGNGNGAPVGDTSGRGGSGGEGGGGGEGGAETKGACDNGSDLDAIEGASGGLRNIARDCGRSFDCAPDLGSSNAYGECVSDCVEGSVAGLSMNCASCYGDLEGCGFAASCRPLCLINTCSPQCLNCLNDADCITAFEDCRGLPGDGCAG